MPRSLPPARRNSLRHPNWDYTSLPGAYFITACAAKGQHLFGEVDRQEIVPNALGSLVGECWLAMPAHHPHVTLDGWQIMPNHFHAVLWLYWDVERTLDGTGTPWRARTVQRAFGKSIPGSLSTLMRTFKSTVSRRARAEGIAIPATCWHRNFYDRIVRNDDELTRFRDYIRANPARWSDDCFHPQAAVNKWNRPWRE